MPTRKYKGYLIEYDSRLRRYGVYEARDKTSVFPTKHRLACTETLKKAKEWINKEVDDAHE